MSSFHFFSQYRPIPLRLGEDPSADRYEDGYGIPTTGDICLPPQRAPRCDRAPCRSSTPAGGRAVKTVVSGWGRPGSQRVALDGSLQSQHISARARARTWRRLLWREPWRWTNTTVAVTGAIAAHGALVLVVGLYIKEVEGRKERTCLMLFGKEVGAAEESYTR